MLVMQAERLSVSDRGSPGYVVLSGTQRARHFPGAAVLVEMQPGMLLVGPGAAAVLAVALVEAACIFELRGGVPREAAMAGFKLVESEPTQPAKLPVRVETDLLQQQIGGPTAASSAVGCDVAAPPCGF